jgi:hypothetical protein
MRGLRTLANNLLWPVWLFLFVLSAGLAAGCTPRSDDPSPDSLLPLDELMGELPPADDPAREDRDEQHPPAVQAGLDAIIRDLGVTRAEVESFSYHQAEWQDGCLGLGEEGEFCTQELVSGWQIFVYVEDYGEYEIRTNDNGRNIRWRHLQ